MLFWYFGTAFLREFHHAGGSVDLRSTERILHPKPPAKQGSFNLDVQFDPLRTRSVRRASGLLETPMAPPTPAPRVSSATSMRRPARVKPFFFGRAIRTSDCRPTGRRTMLSIPKSHIADSPYFHPHSSWRSCPGASWVYSIWIGCCRLGRELTLCFQRVVLRRRRSHPNSAIWFSSFRLPLLSAAAVDFGFATAHIPQRLPTADEAGCPACAQRLQPLSSLHACASFCQG